MERDVVLYITASVDGYIADVSGGVGWLAGAEGEDYGFSRLLDSVDAVLQGSKTYLSTLDLVDSDPYSGKANYVFTSRDDLPVLGSPTFIADDAVKFVSALKRQPGERMWLVGGGALASSLISAGLVDEIDLFIQPVVLGDGVPLWVPPLSTVRLAVIGTKLWPADLVEVRYRVRHEA